MSNDELQKAIDDITSGGDSAAGETTSPANEVVVPSSDVEVGGVANGGFGGSFAEPVAPAVGDMGTSDFGLPMPPADGQPMSGMTGVDGGLGGFMPSPNEPKMEENAGVSNMVEPTSAAPVAPSVPEIKEAPVAAPVAEETKMPELSEDGPKDPELKEVETAALLELYPLLEKMNVNAREKFDICMKVIEKTGEKGATSAALNAAKGIADEKEKGECLVKLVETIDKM